MSKPCDRTGCVLRLERIAASARILASSLSKGTWYDEAKSAALDIHKDAEYVLHAIADDKAWEAGDR